LRRIASSLRSFAIATLAGSREMYPKAKGFSCTVW
jgi:hypothetical protein